MIILTCGVRQGGVLSPVLFAVYVNGIIERLSRSHHGVRIGETYLGCVMYADDLILMSASLCDLQAMVDICSVELESIDRQLHGAKSQVIRFVSHFRNSCKNISVNGVEISYVNKLKYLGCFLVAAKSLKLSLHEMLVKCYIKRIWKIHVLLNARPKKLRTSRSLYDSLRALASIVGLLSLRAVAVRLLGRQVDENHWTSDPVGLYYVSLPHLFFRGCSVFLFFIDLLAWLSYSSFLRSIKTYKSVF